MVAYFLFFFYLFFGTILLHLIIRRKIFPFTIYHTASIVLFKIFMGCLYGWVFLHYYNGDDTWHYFDESKIATDLLLQHPGEFFQVFFPSYSLQAAQGHPWEALIFYVEHFERWFIINGLAILNLLSGKNYYINLLLFEFLTIPGSLLLFKLMAKRFPDRIGKNFLLIFFIPSVIFWCSGIRAEALILLGLSLMIYNGDVYAREHRLRNLFWMLAGFILCLLIRYQYLFVFLPAYVAYLISIWKKEQSPVYFNRIFGVILVFAVVSLFLPAEYQITRPVQKAQQSFFILNGNTRYALDTLETGPLSPIKILPQAFANSILRPYPWEGKTLLQSVSAVDTLIIIFGLMYFVLGPQRKKQVSHPVYWIFLYYALVQLLLIGYTVPFPGAIVRYRCIPFLFLVLFLYAGNPHLQQKLRYWIFKLH